MSLINLSVKHGRSLEEARSYLESAVQKVHSQFRALIQRVTWSTDRNRVRLDGLGFWVEMWVEALEVHVSGDLPVLGRLLGSPMAAAVQRIVQQTFQKKLP
jgi:hypothetical protein